MKFQIQSKKTGSIIIENITIQELLSKISCYLSEIHELTIHLPGEIKKEFVIKCQDKFYQHVVDENPKDFVVVVVRTE